jgi:hypothetical protein
MSENIQIQDFISIELNQKSETNGSTE